MEYTVEKEYSELGTTNEDFTAGRMREEQLLAKRGLRMIRIRRRTGLLAGDNLEV